MKIYAYKTGSKSARALADALGIKRIKHEGKHRFFRDVVINWGASSFNRKFETDLILNYPEAVKKASNKLESFKSFQGRVACPEWTTEQAEAEGWLNNGDIVVIREKLSGHSGEGVVILDPKDNHVGVHKAPLYTKYIKKDQEYRIHVFRGEVIFQQRKARKKEVPDAEVNWKVRNLAGGFIFANVGVEAPECVRAAAVDAVGALGLDFGAADVITNKKGEAFVLEVNTACGLEGSTLDAYVKKFREFV